MRVKGLEPPRREALDPKSSVSTNFTTPASNKVDKYNQVFLKDFSTNRKRSNVLYIYALTKNHENRTKKPKGIFY